jgi:hypothetical protein
MMTKRKYVLTYIDIDGDTISIISDQDLKYLKETNIDKAIKIFVNEVSEAKDKSI